MQPLSDLPEDQVLAQIGIYRGVDNPVPVDYDLLDADPAGFIYDRSTPVRTSSTNLYPCCARFVLLVRTYRGTFLYTVQVQNLQ